MFNWNNLENFLTRRYTYKIVKQWNGHLAFVIGLLANTTKLNALLKQSIDIWVKTIKGKWLTLSNTRVEYPERKKYRVSPEHHNLAYN
jgi:uncharacterized membrane protein